MFKPPRLGQALALIVLACGAAVAPTVTAQDFALDVAYSDRYVRDGILPQGLDDLFDPLGGQLKGGLYFSAGVQAAYNSNVVLTEDYENSDLIFSFTPSVFYTSDPEGGAPFSVTAYYSPVIQMYTDNSGLNSVDHAFGAELNTLGGKTSISIFANYSEFSGADRFTGGFTEGSTLALGIRGSYQVAPRTSLRGMLTASMSDFDNTAGPLAGGSGAETYVAELGALWAATERLRFGPSIRYATIPSSANLNHMIHDDSLPTSATRLFLRSSLECGASVHFSDYEESGITPTNREDETLAGLPHLSPELVQETDRVGGVAALRNEQRRPGLGTVDGHGRHHRQVLKSPVPALPDTDTRSRNGIPGRGWA